MKRDRTPPWQQEMQLKFLELHDQQGSAWDELREGRQKAHEARMRLIWNREDDELQAEVAALEQACTELEARKDDASSKIGAHVEDWKRQEQLYRRPTGWWMNILNRWLGPLPAGVEKIDYDRDEFDAAPGRWPLAVVLAVVAYAVIVVLVISLPASAATPVNVALGRDIGGGVAVGAVTGLLIVALFRRLRRRFFFKDFFYGAALDEEFQFRLGAEKWSWRQRTASCVTFGIAHLINLIYAVATLGVLMLVGAVLMIVYLREFRRTGDHRQSVVAASKLHAHYNLVVTAIGALVLLLYWVSVVVTLLTGR